MACNVYIICYEGGIPPVKVGIASKIERRLDQIQVGNPNKVILYQSFSCPNRIMASSIEEEFHKKMDEKRIRGEWFNISPSEAAPIIVKISKSLEGKVSSEPDPESDKLNPSAIKFFNYLKTHMEAGGDWPLQEEAAAALGFKHRSRLTFLRRELENKGYLKYGERPSDPFVSFPKVPVPI